MEPDERRRQILSAARKLFSKHGYDGVSSELIAREAGVARGLLNHYFGTKRDLYLEVVRGMVRVPPPPVPEYVAGTTPEQRVVESIDDWLEMVSRNRETWLAGLRAESLSRDPAIEAIFEEARQEATDRLIAVLGLGPAAKAPADLHAVLRAYGGMAEAATRQWLEHKRLSREQVAAFLTSSLAYLTGDGLEAVRNA